MGENVVHMLAWLNEDGLRNWRIAQNAQKNGDKRKAERYAKVCEKRFEQFQRMRRLVA